MSTAFLEFHNFDPPATGDTLSPVQYGYLSNEFTGTLVEPTGVPQAAVLGDGYIGFYGGYYPVSDNVEIDVEFGSPVMTGTLEAVEPVEPVGPTMCSVTVSYTHLTLPTIYSV